MLVLWEQTLDLEIQKRRRLASQEYLLETKS